MSFSFNSLVGGNTVCGHNATDEDGNVTGGYATDGVTHLVTDMTEPESTVAVPGMFIRWQDGPLLHRQQDGETFPNGAFLEDVLEVCRRRLECYQNSPLACTENEMAMDSVKDAIELLMARRKDRKERGVEGQYKP